MCCCRHSQVSIHLRPRLVEAIVASAATGTVRVPDIVGIIRRTLGPAVQGCVPTATHATTVVIDEVSAETATADGSADALVAAVPELTTSSEQLVVVSPARLRVEVQRLLRPLADVAIVVGDDELAVA